MLQLMVQGARDARGIEDAVRALGTICKERGIGLNVGEAGQIVRLLAETGAHVRVHQAKPEPPNVPDEFMGRFVRCYSAAKVVHGMDTIPDGISCDRLAWAVRLACMCSSDGFIFFPGREGTLAHLVPIMAFIAKGERDKGVARPRRVALVDWPMDDVKAVEQLFRLELARDRQWFFHFTTRLPTRMGNIVDWLTDGVPAER